ncbi:hypothetical protein ACWU4D_01075 [Vibrio sp. WJH972]
MIFNTVNSIENNDHLFLSSESRVNLYGVNDQLSELAHLPQWIMFTSQCPRHHIVEVSTDQSWSSKVIHLMPSRQFSESDVVEKAIYSGNASAIVASNQIPVEQQSRLYILAEIHDCQLFFVNTRSTLLH